MNDSILQSIGGAIPVYIASDPGSVPATVQYVGSGGLVIPNVIGNEYASATLNTASGTTAVNLVTGAPGYYITDLGFQCDPTATLLAAGIETISLMDSSYGIMAQFRIYIPSTAAAPTVPTIIRQTTSVPYVWNNKTANSTLSVVLGTALTAGSIRVFVRYGICNYLG